MTLILLLPTPTHAACGDPGSQEDVELSVLTYNVWGLPSPLATDRRGRLSRIASWLDERSYDIAGLQEIWRGAVRLLPLPSVRDARRGDSGLALITPHPVRESAQHVFTAERGFDRFKAKGMLSAAIDLDGTSVEVGVTHLQAGGGSRNARIRAAQVEELLSWTETEGPVVLVGDFNLYKDQPIDEQTRQHLEDRGFVDVAAASSATQGTYPGRADRFDRIYVRSGTRHCLMSQAAEVLQLELSDHRPVEARVKLRGERVR